ncbi:isocitrate lyase/PEP mutase family protein [Arthrobacter nitrophenolicus]|uniref:Methylisocitrate lyase n=2 Tax=Arthrobacter nitrophenolicus TaxID=683150 RepID=A0ACC6TL49_9MICC|nr:isocitrate lyase/phosphoenolpyruvate mutase family protein [Arthrobacter nitrophenolicus]ELT42626.1 Carboxyvinyl-carboxyphosphonate phosphorylmutase [Arthrobacter nitrophenolicus]
MVRTLKEVISENSPLVAPLAYDGISARLVRDLKFQAAYIGSYAASASKYGVADIGFVGLEDIADMVRRIAPIVDVPLIVDGEGGFGNPIHVARSVQVLERAGASATHIEDHVFGKHLGTPQVIPLGQAVDKIKAAVDARKSEDFLIIGRSDALLSEGEEATIDRLLAFQEAGADVLFLARAPKPGDVLNKRLREEARVPILMTNGLGYSAKEMGEQGADIVLYPTLTNFVAESAMRQALELLAREGSTVDIVEDYDAFDAFLGAEEYKATAHRLGLLPQS